MMEQAAIPLDQLGLTKFGDPKRFKSVQEISTEIQFLVIDLFCGFGGTSQGFEQARAESILASLAKQFGSYFPSVAKVIGCINHDAKAIESHFKNFPHVEHFEENIKKLYGRVINGILFKSPQLIRLQRLVDIYRALYPNAKIILWASLECVNFSKAKGGQSRDQDSRTLAQHLFPYIHAVDPDLIMIENVVEFMAWGPMLPKVIRTDEGYECCPLIHITPDKKKRKKPKLKKLKKKATPAELLDWEITQWELVEQWKKDNQEYFTPHWIPEKTKDGEDWVKWCKDVCNLGYRDEWRQLNSADFGAYTSRNRLFGVFAKDDMPIIWPEPTHAKNPEKTAKEGKKLERWNAVKEVLDFSEEGNSIYNRKKDLKPATWERLFKGSVKHIAGGKDVYNDVFLSRYYGGNADHRNHTIDEPAGVLTTNNRLSMVSHTFISKYFSGHPESKSSSINDPASTVKPKDNQMLIHAVSFMDQRNGGDAAYKSRSLDEPAKTLTKTGGNQQVVNASFLVNYNHSSHSSGINHPSPTLVTHDKIGLTKAQFLHKKTINAKFIDRQYSQGTQNSSIDEPVGALPTVPKANYVQADFFIDKQYTGGDNNQSIESPAGVITTNDKHCLVQTEKWIMNTNFNNVGSSVEDPAPVITASRHHHYFVNNEEAPKEFIGTHLIVAIDPKREPLYYIMASDSPIILPVYERDCEWCIKLKEFMVIYHIVDIKMRMLFVKELIQIQGFPKDYIMVGSDTDKKKFIGNSVVPAVVEHWILAYSKAVFEDDYEIYRMAA